VERRWLLGEEPLKCYSQKGIKMQKRKMEEMKYPKISDIFCLFSAKGAMEGTIYIGCDVCIYALSTI